MNNYTFNEVTKITLLSIEEVEKLPKWVRSCEDWWWLRSPGNFRDYAALVISDGSVTCIGLCVDYDGIAVRPALTILNLKSSNLEIGETVKVGDYMAQYIGNNKVLMCEPIGQHRFDAKTNDYEKSEIKAYIEKWLNERKRAKMNKQEFEQFIEEETE